MSLEPLLKTSNILILKMSSKLLQNTLSRETNFEKDTFKKVFFASAVIIGRSNSPLCSLHKKRIQHHLHKQAINDVKKKHRCTILNMTSPEAWKLISTCMISTSCMSFVASTIVAIMVGRSTTTGADGLTKSTLLSSPYHRIIFGISVSDIFQSFALLSGPFAVPAYVPQALWAVGNNTTCKMNGFTFYIGVACTPMYTFFFCYFCLCKVKKGMTDEAFSQNVEWKLHSFIIISNMCVCMAALVTKTFNSSVLGQFCTFAAVPAGCRQNPYIFGECDETSAKSAVLFTLILGFVIFFSSLVGIIVCMFQICWYVMITRKRIFRGSDLAERSARRHQQEGIQKEKFYRRQFLIQACLYISAYLVTHILPSILSIVLFINEDMPSTWISTTTSILYPIGGLFNILVYSRPKVVSLRRRNAEYSWFKAFATVVKAGGVVPMVIDEDDQSSDEKFPPAMNASSSGIQNNHSEPENGGPVDRKYYRFPIPTTPIQAVYAQNNFSVENLSDEGHVLTSSGMETIREGDEEGGG